MNRGIRRVRLNPKALRKITPKCKRSPIGETYIPFSQYSTQHSITAKHYITLEQQNILMKRGFKLNAIRDLSFKKAEIWINCNIYPL